MSQLEISAAGRESPAQALSGQFLKANSGEKTKEGEQDGRKPFVKKSSKPADTIVDFSSMPDGALLDPLQRRMRSQSMGPLLKSHLDARPKDRDRLTTAYRAMKKIQEMRKQTPPRFWEKNPGLLNQI